MRTGRATGGKEVTTTRYDILNVSAPAHRVEHLLKAALGATDEPNKFGPKTHLTTSNGGRLRVSPAVTNEAVAVVSLNSDLPDAEHNAWAVEVFNAACAATTSTVELFDEDDNVISSHRTA